MQTYGLKDGRKVVYRGSLNDLERREREHGIVGKGIYHMVFSTSPEMTKQGARKKEVENLEKL